MSKPARSPALDFDMAARTARQVEYVVEEATPDETSTSALERADAFRCAALALLREMQAELLKKGEAWRGIAINAD